MRCARTNQSDVFVAGAEHGRIGPSHLYTVWHDSPAHACPRTKTRLQCHVVCVVHLHACAPQCPDGYTLINGGCDYNDGEGRTSRLVCKAASGSYVPCSTLPNASPVAWACGSATGESIPYGSVVASAECCGPTPVPGQTCASAKDAQPGSNPFDTSTAIDSVYPVCGGSFTSVPKVVWFRYTATTATSRFTVAGTFTSLFFAVYDACASPVALVNFGGTASLSCVGCESPNVAVPTCTGSTFLDCQAQPGKEYIIAIGSNTALGGITGDLTIEPVPLVCI